MSGNSERKAARSVVADYHDAQLAELVARVGEAIDRYGAGELDAFDIDRVLFQYSRAAKELWKFCNYLQVEVAATMIRGAATQRLVGTRSAKTALTTCAPTAPNTDSTWSPGVSFRRLFCPRVPRPGARERS